MNIKNNFTAKTRELIENASSFALKSNNQSVDVSHLFWAMLNQTDTLIKPLFDKLSLDINKAKIQIKEKLNKLPTVNGGEQYISSDVKSVLTEASKIAQSFGDEYISVEHVFIAMLKKSTNVADIIKNIGGNFESINSTILELRNGEKITDENPEDKFQALEKYCVNFTNLAKGGKIDPVIGRNDEIRRLMQILARRSKNNPVLIGEPGTGKTAIVEGLANRIIQGDVPETLKNKELLSLDLGALIAGAKYRGEFEDRLKSVIKQIKSSDGHFILFIDELHTLVGAGAQEGQMDASNMLKPALARGEIHMIGATTLKEYQKYIEKDSALERRFQPIAVNEPSIEDTIAILRGIKEKYELYHGVKILDEAIIDAAVLSDRYISDRFLPDKAVDLIDEATAVLKIALQSSPQEIDQLNRDLMQLEIEKQALKNEKNQKEKIVILDEKISTKKEKLNSLQLAWQNEKNLIDKINTNKEKIENLNNESNTFERNGELAKVAEIRYGKIPELEKENEKLAKNLKNIQGSKRMINEEVTSDDIASVVSKWTGIPVNKLKSTESEKLLNLETSLENEVIGQEDAIKAVSNVIRRSKANISEENRPIGSFLFLGPTGVGKTELSKAIARFLFNDEHSLIRLDMSEYMESHSISKILGSPPGYVGYDEGGQLTEKIRKKPYSVILFDEVEKAHPQIFNALLQILDEGHITDSKGRIVNFKNTIIILTSNIGSDDILNLSDKKEELNKKIQEKLGNFFKPEFLNRIDNIITFNSLSQSDVEKITKLNLSKLEKRLKKQSINLNISKKAISFVAQNAYDSKFGARPLKRYIQDNIENVLALNILSGKFKAGSKINIDVKSNKLVIED